MRGLVPLICLSHGMGSALLVVETLIWICCSLCCFPADAALGLVLCVMSQEKVMPVCSVQHAVRMPTKVTVMVMVMVWGVFGCITACADAGWTDLNLPEEHIPCFLHNNPEVREKCSEDDTCPYKVTV